MCNLLYIINWKFETFLLLSLFYNDSDNMKPRKRDFLIMPIAA